LISRQTRCAGFSSHPWFLHLGPNKHVHLLFLSLIFASRTQEACALWSKLPMLRAGWVMWSWEDKVSDLGRQSTTWIITQLWFRVELWYIFIVIPKTSHIQLNRLSHYPGIWIWMKGWGFGVQAWSLGPAFYFRWKFASWQPKKKKKKKSQCHWYKCFFLKKIGQKLPHYGEFFFWSHQM